MTLRPSVELRSTFAPHSLCLYSDAARHWLEGRASYIAHLRRRRPGHRAGQAHL